MLPNAFWGNVTLQGAAWLYTVSIKFKSSSLDSFTCKQDFSVLPIRCFKLKKRLTSLDFLTSSGGYTTK